MYFYKLAIGISNLNSQDSFLILKCCMIMKKNKNLFLTKLNVKFNRMIHLWLPLGNL